MSSDDADRAEQAAARAEADIEVAAAETEREARATRAAVQGDREPAVDPGRRARRPVTLVLLVLGALSLLCSLILAVGALLAAVEAGSSGLVDLISAICDVLVGPLGGLAEGATSSDQSRSDLVARGLASMLYLAVGLGLQSLARKQSA